MRKKGDDSDFECVMVVEELLVYWDFPTWPSLVYRE